MRRALLGAVVAMAVALGLMASPAAARDGHRHDKDGRHHVEQREDRRHKDGHDRWRGDRDDRRDRHDRRDGERGDRDRRDDDRRGDRGEQPRELTAEDRAFVETAAQVALAEIFQGQLAIDRSDDPVVQEYGRMMMVDHFKQLVEQLPIMRAADIELPALTEAQMTVVSELAAVAPEDFDVTYLQLQVVNHEAALELFGDRAENAEDRKVRKFATSQLPVLFQHLDAAKAALATQELPAA